MNLEQKADAILAAVSTPVVATVDPTVLATAISTALEPVLAQLTTIAAGVADIQGEVDEPAPVTPAA